MFSNLPKLSPAPSSNMSKGKFEGAQSHSPKPKSGKRKGYDRLWQYSLFVKNPKEKAGILSRLTFCWMGSVLKIGYRRAMECSDLYPLLEEDKARTLTEHLDDLWHKEVREFHISGKQPSLLRAMRKVFSWTEYTLLSIALFLGIACNILKPLLLGLLISMLLSVGKSTSDEELQWLYTYAGTICVAALLQVLALHQYQYKVHILGMRWRAAVVGLLYKKILKLRHKDLARVSPGQIMSHVSSDAQHITYAFQKIGSIFQGVLELTAVTALLWRLVGFQAVSGIVFLIFLLAFYIGMWDVCAKLRLKLGPRTEKRMSLLRTLVSGIRTIKMNVWEKPFMDLVKKIRRQEMWIIYQKTAILGSFATFLYTSQAIACFISLTTLMMIGATLTPYTVFLTVALIRTIRISVSPEFAGGINYVGQFLTSIKRIQRFLELIESRPLQESYQRSMPKSKYRSLLPPHDSSLDLTRCFSSEELSRIAPEGRRGRTRPMSFLEGDQAHEPDAELVMENVSCSWRDSDKTTALWNVSLEASKSEMTLIVGSSGCGKSALLSAILGELPPSEGTISCKGKISYSPQFSWVFSGSFRENVLFGELFNPFRYKAVLNACLLQKDIDKLPDGDLTAVGRRGSILSSDQSARISLARAAYSDADIYLIDDIFAEMEPRSVRSVFEKCVCEVLGDRIRVLVSRQLRFVERADHVLTMRNGTIVNEVATEVKSHKSQKSTSVSPVAQEWKRQTDGNVATLNGVEKRNGGGDYALEEDEKVAGPVPWGVYWRYFRAGMSTPVILIVFLLYIATQGAIIFPDVWLLRMLQTPNKSFPLFHQELYLYTGFVILALLMSLYRAYFFLFTALRSSNQIHQRMAEAFLKAKVQFFNRTPVSTILNRISRDVRCQDEMLPSAFLDTVQLALFFIGTITLCSVLNYALILPAVFLVAFILALREYYMKTARELLKLETVTRAPVFSHFSDSLKGLLLLRAHGMEDRFVEDLYRYQDGHNQAWFAILSGASWVGIRLDLLCILFLAVAVFGCLLMHTGPAATGLVVICALQLIYDPSQHGVRQSSEVDRHMTSVERNLAYTDIEREPGYDIQTMPRQPWPKKGALRFDNMSLTFHQEGPKSLDSLTIKIRPKEKIGVVGRDGSGKTAFVNALMRMPEPGGQIVVDDIGIANLNLQASRRGITVISRRPVIITGTLRVNLDPFVKYSEKDIWSVLEKVNLKSWVESLPRQLYHEIYDGCPKMTMGEQQLISLARALLVKSRITVFDEATAIVDYKTDRVIQEIIRTQFKESTVITVPTRLNTIIDYDRILVLDKGRVVEYDTPEALLKKADGYFAQLHRSQCAL